MDNLRYRLIKQKCFTFLLKGVVSIIFIFLFLFITTIFFKSIPVFYSNTFTIKISSQMNYELRKDIVNAEKNTIFMKHFGEKIFIQWYKNNVIYNKKDHNYKKIGLASSLPPRYVLVHFVSLGAYAKLAQAVIKNKNHSFKFSMSFDPTYKTEKKYQKTFDHFVQYLKSNRLMRKYWTLSFFTQSDSQNPHYAGILSALTGSLYTMLITIFLTSIIGILSGIYLQEFSPRSKFIDFIEININNLASVPSIIFGLLGLSIFLYAFHLPRSSSLVGGVILSLITLPTMIIITRSNLSFVDIGIRQAALAMGASKMQVIFHHVLPAAMPGIMTSSLVGFMRAFGETAPLLMIGMVAFITTPPKNFLDPSTSLPVQLYMWAQNPNPMFLKKAIGATMVLLFILIVTNLSVFLFRMFLERND